MALSKTSLVFCVSMIVFFVVMADVADAKFISYGALMHDGKVCTKRAGCVEQENPSNSYNRGCEASQRCRGGPGSSNDDPEEQ